MNTQEIYKEASQLTPTQIEQTLAQWQKDGENEKLSTYNFLVNTGDTKALALATANQERVDNSNEYRVAYSS